MAFVSPPTIPIGLADLFESAGFIASAEEDCKPYFKGKKHVKENSWYGWAQRKSAGEDAGTTKSKIRRICEGMSQAYDQYKESQWSEIILNKMIKLRFGIMKIQGAYAIKDQNTVDHLDDSIVILDFKIPEHIKLKYGFRDVGKSSLLEHELPMAEIIAAPNQDTEDEKEEE